MRGANALRLFSPRRRAILSAAVAVCAVAGYATREAWLESIGRSLICEEGRSSDVLLLDYFDVDYGLFRRAADMQTGGGDSGVFIPIVSSYAPEASIPDREIALTLARLAGLSRVSLVEIRESEPISLHAAYQIRDALVGGGATSVTIISPAFRSKRTALIYEAVLGQTGITVSCVPVPGGSAARVWTHSLHGIQDVVLQFLKLQYYRFLILPRI